MYVVTHYIEEVKTSPRSASLNIERLTEVIRILRKRLGSANMRVLSVGLTLAETLVKNCHDPVHREMASERFMAAVARIARVRRSGFINSWEREVFAL